MSNDFPLYTTDYISGIMSLRKPQTQSLKILEEITNAVQLRKDMNLKAALGAVTLCIRFAPILSGTLCPLLLLWRPVWARLA